MSQIRFFSEEQEARIPLLQEKWQAVAFSTERIDRDRATESLKEVYSVMGKPEPEIIFCASPHAAIERLKPYISSVEIPQQNTVQSPEEVFQDLNFVKFFARAAWGTFQQNNKRKEAESRIVFDLINQLSQQPNKLLSKHTNDAIPQDLTTQEIVEQSFLGATPLFNILAREQARQGEPDLSKAMSTNTSEAWDSSFSQTASALEQQLSWLPGKKFLFRQWLKRFLFGALSSQITGVEYPKLKEVFYYQLIPSQQKFYIENPPVITSELAINCILLDFYFSVMNYPHQLQKWEALQNLVQHCGWIFGFNNTCLICDRPTKLIIDENQQLHGEGETAVEYSDGYKAYAHHGYLLPEKYGVIDPSAWQSEWVLPEENRQLQKVLIQNIGVARICRELDLIEVEKSREYIAN